MHAEPLTADAINAAEWSQPRKKGLNPTVLKAQVLLGRAGFSPGVIDARGGENFRKAVAAFQRRHELAVSGTLDQATWGKLTETSSEPVMTDYEIKPADVKGPFVERIPREFEKMAELERLSYRSPREALAEKFHMSEDLLKNSQSKKIIGRRPAPRSWWRTSRATRTGAGARTPIPDRARRSTGLAPRRQRASR